VIFGFVVLILLLRKILGGDGRPAGAPNTVMVVVVNRTGHQPDYIDKVIENRREYAQAHGTWKEGSEISSRSRKHLTR
jgi:mannan polymerase II complex MNN11 subunit